MLAYEQAVLDLDPVIYLPMSEVNSGASTINLAVSELGKPDFPMTPVRTSISHSAEYPPGLQPETSPCGSWDFNGTSSYVTLVDGTYNGNSVDIPGWNTEPGASLDAWTIGCWINMSGASGSAVWRDIFRISDYGAGFAIFTGATATTFETFRSFTYDGSGTFYGQDRSAKWTEGGWRFLWAQFDGDRIYTGIDDWWVVRKSTSIPSSTSFGNDSTPFIALGRNGQYSQEYFKGKMCHFMMFDHAVDRTALYNLFDLAIGVQDINLSHPTRELHEKSTGPRIDVVPIREELNTLPPQGDGLTLIKDNMVVNFGDVEDIWNSGVDLIELTPNKYVSIGVSGASIVYTILQRNPSTNEVTLLTSPSTIGSYTSVSRPYFVRLSSTKILFCYVNSTNPRIREAIITFNDATNTMTAGSGTTLFSTVYGSTQSIEIYTGRPLKLTDTTIIRATGASASAIANGRSPTFLVYDWNPGTNTLSAAATNQFQTGSFDGRLNGGRTNWPSPCLFKIDNTRFAFLYKRYGNRPNDTDLSRYQGKVVMAVGTWNGSTISFSDPLIYRQEPPEGWTTTEWLQSDLVGNGQQLDWLFRIEDFPAGGAAAAQQVDVMFRFNGSTLEPLREYMPWHSFAVDDGTQEWQDSWWYTSDQKHATGDSVFQYKAIWPGSGDIVDLEIQRVVFEDGYVHYCRPRPLFQAGEGCLDVGPLGAIYLGDNRVMVLYQAYREATPGQGWNDYKTELRADIYELATLNPVT